MTIDAIILKQKYVDVCAGPMTPEQLGREVAHYIKMYSGNSIIVTVDKSKVFEEKPYCAIYITRKDFKEGFIPT